jgi:hypothetical protein
MELEQFYINNNTIICRHCFQENIKRYWFSLEKKDLNNADLFCLTATKNPDCKYIFFCSANCMRSFSNKKFNHLKK